MSAMVNPYLIEAQPHADEDLSGAVVTWHYVDGAPQIISRYVDPLWVSAAIGGLSASTISLRSIDFGRLPEHWRDHARLALYAALRHPYRIRRPPTFSALIKKWGGLEKYFRYLENLGVQHPNEALAEHVDSFMRQVTASVAHIETVVSQYAVLLEINNHHGLGLLPFRVPVPAARWGAPRVARALWREVHHEDFDDKGGIQPYVDEDAAYIVRLALFYVKTLSPEILLASEHCNEIALRYPERRSNRSHEGLCFRAQLKALAAIRWSVPDAGFYNWPPRRWRQLRTHQRLLSAACAIVILFALGCRRSEILGIRDDSLRHKDGEWVMHMTRFKGEEDLEGRPVQLPVCAEASKAVEVQLALKRIFNVNIHGFDDPPPTHDRLFVLARHRHFVDLDRESIVTRNSGTTLDADEFAEQIDTGMEGGPLSASGLNAFLRDFKKYVTPEIDGPLSPHRFRKTVARLVTLTMEGGPLILQEIFGHNSYATTLKYMFASPFIQEELLEAYPDMTARNLHALFQSRGDLGGGGARGLAQGMASFRTDAAAAQTGVDVGMTEAEFVELGVTMVKEGHMTLSVLAQGVYCLKPVGTRGPCSRSADETLPNLGRCSTTCHHHVELGSRRPVVERTIAWLKKTLRKRSLSKPMRAFYKLQLSEQLAIFPSKGGLDAN